MAQGLGERPVWWRSQGPAGPEGQREVPLGQMKLAVVSGQPACVVGGHQVGGQLVWL